MTITKIDLGKARAVALSRYDILSRVTGSVDYPEAFADGETVRRALSALRRGPIRFYRDNVIACEGDTADYIFLVVSGVVRTCKRFQNGTRSILAFYLPGDLVGWAELKQPLSVEAATDTLVLFLKRKALLSLASQENRVARFLLAGTTNELRRAQEHGLLISRSAKTRVATFLTDLWTRLEQPKQLDLPMSHQDIADHLGLTVETLSRTITVMERSGIVTRESKRRLCIHHRPSLVHMMN